MGVTDAATGKCTNEALADFISAWAGVTRASAIVSVCLAENRDDNATRAAAKAAGEAIREAARAALAEALPQATAIAGQGKAISDTGLSLLASHIGAFARAACIAATAGPIQGPAGGRAHAAGAGAADAAAALALARGAQVTGMMAGMALDPASASALREQITRGLESSGWKPPPTGATAAAAAAAALVAAAAVASWRPSL